MKEQATPIQQRRDDVLRDLLRNEFQRRAEKNPAFSLRALSQKIALTSCCDETDDKLSQEYEGNRDIYLFDTSKLE
jgi:hypothetical protein